jgi:hypothetical protein
VAFSVRGDDVLILGVFARGRDITEEILKERNQRAPVVAALSMASST